MIYYRVAIKTDQHEPWRWRSTILTSLDALFGFLKLYSMVPADQIRVFYSSALEYLNVMLDCENKGLPSNSITAEHLLKGKRSINLLEMARLEMELGAIESRKMVEVETTVNASQATQSWHERYMNALYETSNSVLDVRRLEFEIGTTGDHDLPYTLTLPSSMPQALAWAALLTKVYTGELEP